jgi:hypothetical protein
MHAPRPRIRVQQNYVLDDLIGVLEHFERPRKRHASGSKSQAKSETSAPAIDQPQVQQEAQQESQQEAQTETSKQECQQKEHQGQASVTNVPQKSRPIHPFALMIDGVFDVLEQLHQSSHKVPLESKASFQHCCGNCAKSAPTESGETTITSSRVANETLGESKSVPTTLEESHQEQSHDYNVSVHSNESGLSMLERLQTKSTPVLEKDNQEDYVSV